MEFTINRNLLLGELSLVQGVVEKKSTIPILSNILLATSGSRLDITATDLDVSICCGCEAEIITEGTTTLAARRLFDIVRLLPENAEIHFLLLENDWVEVRAASSEYKVVGLPKENFPAIPEPTAEKLTLPGTVLKGMIQKTMFAITQEESRYFLNGALLILTPQEMQMVATDGHRLAVVAKAMEIGGVDQEIKSLIPRKMLMEIQKLIGDGEVIVEFARDENHLFFSVEGKRLVSRILAGQFPNYEMVLPKENDKTFVVPTQVVNEGVRRAAVMADEKMRSIRLALNPGTLEMTASSAEAGEAREVIEVEYQGASLEIGFNPQYLLDFLGACGSDRVTVSVKDHETQALFRPDEQGDLDYRYVVMPMKI